MCGGGGGEGCYHHFCALFSVVIAEMHRKHKLYNTGTSILFVHHDCGSTVLLEQENKTLVRTFILHQIRITKLNL